MNLLLDRKQKYTKGISLVPLKIGNSVTFSLHASLELSEEEKNLLLKYGFWSAALVISSAWEDLKSAFRPALILGVFSFVIAYYLFGWRLAVPLGMAVVIGMTGVYFEQFREQILVKDLLDDGRKFRCNSIIDLIHKEAYLQSICGYLRQVLESAKHWDEREIVPIEPLSKEEAKQATLKRLSVL